MIFKLQIVNKFRKTTIVSLQSGVAAVEFAICVSALVLILSGIAAYVPEFIERQRTQEALRNVSVELAELGEGVLTADEISAKVRSTFQRAGLPSSASELTIKKNQAGVIGVCQEKFCVCAVYGSAGIGQCE